MCAFFSFFRTQPGIEPGHPRTSTLYPKDIIRNTIGHVGYTIYVINEVLFIYYSLLTLHIYAIYMIYKMHIRYIQYLLRIRYIIHIYDVCFFLFSGPNQVLNQGILVPGIQKMSSITPSVTWVLVNEVLFIYHSLFILHIYAIYKIYNMHIRYIKYILQIRYIIHI